MLPNVPRSSQINKIKEFAKKTTDSMNKVFKEEDEYFDDEDAS